MRPPLVVPTIMDCVLRRLEVLVVLNEDWCPNSFLASLIFFSTDEVSCSRERELLVVPEPRAYRCVEEPYKAGWTCLAELEPLVTWKWLLDIFLDSGCHIEPVEFSFSPPTLVLSVIVVYIYDKLFWRCVAAFLEFLGALLKMFWWFWVFSWNGFYWVTGIWL